MTQFRFKDRTLRKNTGDRTMTIHPTFRKILDDWQATSGEKERARANAYNGEAEAQPRRLAAKCQNGPRRPGAQYPAQRLDQNPTSLG